MYISSMNYGFKTPTIKPTDYFHNDGKLGDQAINPSGDWTNYLPLDVTELQNSNGFETYACVTEATLHCVETLQNFEYQDPTLYSVRFLATIAGTGPQQGNDPGTVAEALRASGCPQNADYGFSAADYATFYENPPANILKLAKAQFADDSFGHAWLQDTTPATIMNALTYSPVAASVFAWPIISPDGLYHRPPGAQDCHMITIYGYIENQEWHIFDSYDQTHKKLAWDYGFGYAKRYTLNRAIPTAPNPNTGWINWPVFINYMRNLLHI